MRAQLPVGGVLVDRPATFAIRACFSSSTTTASGGLVFSPLVAMGSPHDVGFAVLTQRRPSAAPESTQSLSLMRGSLSVVQRLCVVWLVLVVLSRCVLGRCEPAEG